MPWVRRTLPKRLISTCGSKTLWLTVFVLVITCYVYVYIYILCCLLLFFLFLETKPARTSHQPIWAWLKQEDFAALPWSWAKFPRLRRLTTTMVPGLLVACRKCHTHREHIQIDDMNWYNIYIYIYIYTHWHINMNIIIIIKYHKCTFKYNVNK